MPVRQRPGLPPSHHRQPTVDAEGLAGDVAGLRGREVENRARHLLGGADPAELAGQRGGRVAPPARLYPPGEAGSIRAGLEEAGGFLPFVFGTDPAADRGQQMRQAMRRYAGFLSRSHSGDEPIG